jgi:LysW-gamma-L-lysine carboxypeptidase
MRMELAMNEAAAVDLLHGLVAIPSLSHAEAAASAWLVQQMSAAGYDRAYVDAAGNAVGELGPADAARLLVLLGHIDTVPGNIRVRVEESDAGPLLYGRGSVDAKGPLATATAGVARLGSAWAHTHNVRLVVVGAVEEEAASSKGARFIRDRFDGVREPVPDACIIGEPSAWHRVTLGYKGRILVELEASQPMAHTAGPDAGVATVAVDFWNWLSAYAAAFNQGRDKAFDQLLPSLRSLRTFTDDAMHDHVIASSGIRLPLDFAIDRFAQDALTWAEKRTNSVAQDSLLLNSSPPASPTSAGTSPISNLQSHNLTLSGPLTTITLRFSAYEPAWRGERSNALCRSFLAALRAVAPAEKLGFVVKTGTSDMNVVGPAWRCPILAYGPGDSSLDHTPHEHVALDEYWRAVRVLEEALRVWVMG